MRNKIGWGNIPHQFLMRPTQEELEAAGKSLLLKIKAEWNRDVEEEVRKAAKCAIEHLETLLFSHVTSVASISAVAPPLDHSGRDKVLEFVIVFDDRQHGFKLVIALAYQSQSKRDLNISSPSDLNGELIYHSTDYRTFDIDDFGHRLDLEYAAIRELESFLLSECGISGHGLYDARLVNTMFVNGIKVHILHSSASGLHLCFNSVMIKISDKKHTEMVSSYVGVHEKRSEEYRKVMLAGVVKELKKAEKAGDIGAQLRLSALKSLLKKQRKSLTLTGRSV